MRNLFVVAFMGVLLSLFVSVPANAGGSNDPTPYKVDTAGITLPGNDTFQANGHVNIKYTYKGQSKSAGIHFDPNNNQPGGKWIGRNFIPWSAFSPDVQCVTWVQISNYNEHYGEGGQKPVCMSKPPTSPPTKSEDREVITKVNCEERIVEWRKDRREAMFDFDWNKYDWYISGWHDWKQIDSGFYNKLDASCSDLPEVGSPVNLGLLGIAAVLLVAGAAFVVRRS